MEEPLSGEHLAVTAPRAKRRPSRTGLALAPTATARGEDCETSGLENECGEATPRLCAPVVGGLSERQCGEREAVSRGGLEPPSLAARRPPCKKSPTDAASDSATADGKPASLRPANNALLYKAHFHAACHAGTALPDAARAALPDATEACASVTLAFLQVIRALVACESLRCARPRNLLALLASNTRRTKVVSLASGSHRVPDELRRHTLRDCDGLEYSTNLDRNRYGTDDQYLFTVLQYDLRACGLCPALVSVEILDAKRPAAPGTVIAAPECECICGQHQGATPRASAALPAPTPLPMRLPFHPPAATTPPRAAKAPAQAMQAVAAAGGGATPSTGVTQGGIDMLLQALAACGHVPPPSPFACGKGAAAAAVYAAAAAAAVHAAAASEGAACGDASGRLVRGDPFHESFGDGPPTAAAAPAPARRRLPLLHTEEAEEGAQEGSGEEEEGEPCVGRGVTFQGVPPAIPGRLGASPPPRGTRRRSSLASLRCALAEAVAERGALGERCAALQEDNLALQGCNANLLALVDELRTQLLHAQAQAQAQYAQAERAGGRAARAEGEARRLSALLLVAQAAPSQQPLFQGSSPSLLPGKRSGGEEGAAAEEAQRPQQRLRTSLGGSGASDAFRRTPATPLASGADGVALRAAHAQPSPLGLQGGAAALSPSERRRMPPPPPPRLEA